MESVLRRIDLPLGPELVPDMRVGDLWYLWWIDRCWACCVFCACHAVASAAAALLGATLCVSGCGRADAPSPGRCLPQVVQRARQEDLDTVVRYQVAFLRVS